MTLEGRRAKIVLAVLAVSLVANIFAVSFVAGRWSVENRRPPAAMRMAYPPAIRDDIRDAIAARREEMAGAVRRLREARAAMRAAARASAFDAAALDRSMAEVREATAAVQVVSQNALAEALAKASPEDRAAIRQPRGGRRAD
jgi:uncharacterized membrane protein